MGEPAKILLIDDALDLRRALTRLLSHHGYSVESAGDGPDGLARIEAWHPDLVLLDVEMPGLSGYDVCRRIREDPRTAILPVILVTGLDAHAERLRGLESGADDFLTKPVDEPELLVRVRSLLRIKRLYDTVDSQARELASWNQTLEQRVREQVSELERLSRLKRFFSPQLAELIVSGETDDPLKSHRRELTVVFIDLRGFTAFTETSEPEDVMAILREYHAEIGRLILEYEGTLERFAGDGMMVFFNDPLPIPDPAARAVRMAVAIRERFGAIVEKWHRRGFDLHFGIGIAHGFATIGMIGFEGRWDYGAIGTVMNLAARLCGEAQAGKILVSSRVQAEVDDLVVSEPAGELTLKGFQHPVPAFSVLGLRGAT